MKPPTSPLICVTQGACLWAVNHRAMPCSTGLTAWKTKARKWSAGTHWPTNCLDPLSRSKTATFCLSLPISNPYLIGCTSLSVSDRGSWVISMRRCWNEFWLSEKKLVWYQFWCGRTWYESGEQLFNYRYFNSSDLWVLFAVRSTLTPYFDLKKQWAWRLKCINILFSTQ